MIHVEEHDSYIDHATLDYLLSDLSEEYSNVTILINQLQLSELPPKQKAQILAELMTAAIHLQVHCGQEFQDLIVQEIENLLNNDQRD